jgi:hypothetical protein
MNHYISIDRIQCTSYVDIGSHLIYRIIAQIYVNILLFYTTNRQVVGFVSVNKRINSLTKFSPHHPIKKHYIPISIYFFPKITMNLKRFRSALTTISCPLFASFASTRSTTTTIRNTLSNNDRGTTLTANNAYRYGAISRARPWRHQLPDSTLSVTSGYRNGAKVMERVTTPSAGEREIRYNVDG